MVDRSEHGLHRRVTGHHDLRLDGIGDLLFRATGTSVLDVGCNRGMAGYEFACNGARLVHGCDTYETGIMVAREIFADMRQVEHKFEVLDLTYGAPKFREKFGADQDYDIVLLLAITHKLSRDMASQSFRSMVHHFGSIAKRYVGWRGPGHEFSLIDDIMQSAGLKNVQYSEISESICPAAIWRRPQ